MKYNLQFGIYNLKCWGGPRRLLNQDKLGSSENPSPLASHLLPKNGNAWVGIILLLTFLLSLSLALVSEAVLTISQSKKAAQVLVAQSLCDAGIEKAVFELNNGGSEYTGEDNLNLEVGVIDIEIENIDAENKNIITTAYVPNKENPKQTRIVRAKISAETNETGVAFNYGVQAGDGGLTLSNQALLNGNVYTAGNIVCGNTSPLNITGDAFISSSSLGTYGSMSGCKVGGNAEAYSMTGSTITGWGEYVGLKTGTTAVGGLTQITEEQLDQDLPYISMGITEPTIQNWESWAAQGGTYSGNYTLGVGQTATIGPKKIDGNLTLSSGSTLTLSGVVWVKGNIILNTGSAVNLAASYGPNSGMLIADEPDDRANEGYVRVYSNVGIQGSGNSDSYILILSTSQKDGLSDPAIFAGNNSDAVVYYSGEGMIEVNNNASLKAISGGGIHLSNGAEVNYDSGLASANFSGGPGGSWEIVEWQVIH